MRSVPGRVAAVVLPRLAAMITGTNRHSFRAAGSCESHLSICCSLPFHAPREFLMLGDVRGGCVGMARNGYVDGPVRLGPRTTMRHYCNCLQGGANTTCCVLSYVRFPKALGKPLFVSARGHVRLRPARSWQYSATSLVVEMLAVRWPGILVAVSPSPAHYLLTAPGLDLAYTTDSRRHS